MAVDSSCPQDLGCVPISPAEARVLLALCQGASNRAIASCLQLSHRTVEGHVSSLLEKSGCRCRTQLVLWAQRQGLIPVQSASTPV
ncbi:MAG: LuxR C-terminal-related transcriptional regulator [Synechococcaceae cyanobacterium]|nr:LuxR C-terminal-related transcriptional regulator [Synechococcaceae cyanobacterium]